MLVSPLNRGEGNVRFGSLADMTARAPHVCFTPNSGYQPTANECPVCAISRHRGRSTKA
jgi:hypothetical protein